MMRCRGAFPYSIALLCCLLLPLRGMANDMKFSASGFMSLAAGVIMGGDQDFEFAGYRAPVFIADYGQGGVYEKARGLQTGPDSKLGLQANLAINERLGLTAQVVAHGANRSKINLEWLYASYQIDNKLSLQIGRKRLPLFYYSESQDVGLAYPWVRLPPQMYGWNIVNYNGVSLLYRDQLGPWAAALDVFAGDERRHDNPFWKIYFGKEAQVKEHWSQILGSALTLTRDWLELRFSVVQSNWEYSGEVFLPPFQPKTRQRFYNASLNADPGDWVMRAEFSYIDRRPGYELNRAQSWAIGHRFGAWLPLLSFARYRQTYLADGPAWTWAPSDAEAHDLASISLRYDVNPTSAIKLQYDRWSDHNGASFGAQGNPRLLTLGYDMVF